MVLERGEVPTTEGKVFVVQINSREGEVITRPGPEARIQAGWLIMR